MSGLFSRGPRAAILVRNQIMFGRTTNDIIDILRAHGYTDKQIRAGILEGVRIHSKEQYHLSKEKTEERVAETLAILQKRGY